MQLVDNTGFYNIEQYIDESYMDWSSTDPKDMPEYPITFLQDALGGIMKSELIVIGADSGCGKTTIANDLAFHNVERGKRVYLFSLEGDRYEVMQRQRYKEYMKMVNTSKCWEKSVTYRDFIQNKCPHIADDILTLDELFKKKYQNLHIYTRENSLNIDRFKGHLKSICNNADMIILDHLHYFDFNSRDEYSELNDIMKQLKRLQDEYRIPIILISHLRKKDKTRIFPDQNDFHGSSNIVKQADTVICISHMELESEEDNTEHEKQIKDEIYSTGVRIAKARTGFSSKTLGILDFDLNTRQYRKQYKLAICGKHFISMVDESNYPKWAGIHGKTKYNDRTRPPKSVL